MNVLKCVILAVAMCSPMMMLSQNLVPNGGFEEIWNCPTAGGQINGYLKHWFTTFSTPDLLHTCGAFQTFWSEPRSGDACVAIVNLSLTNLGQKEYLHVELKGTLLKDSLYYFSAWLRPNSNRFYHTDQFHVVFSDTMVSYVPEANVDAGHLPLPPDIRWQGGVIPWGDEWILFEDCYRARGDERYMIIGNFFPDSLTTIDTGTLLGSGYRWDDIELIPLSLPRGPALSDRCEGDTIILPVYPEDITITIDGAPAGEEYIPNRAGILDVQMHHRLCGVVDSMKLRILECPEPEICDVYLPTAFSPNNDGINDEWQVKTPCVFSYFAVELYSRWGERVFATDRAEVGWDGTFRGKPMPSDVYTGYIRYSWEGIDQEFRQGLHIQLVR